MNKQYFIVKRLIDLLLSIIIFILFLPLILAVSLLIIIIDKNSPLFIQKRSGKNCKQFKIYKFRTMKFNTITNSLEITDFGKFIRLTKIDEIPQIINILKNEMSFIGPRPLYLDFDNHYKKKHLIRSSLKPGITGLAQIKLRDSTNWNTKFNYDVIYIKKVSIKLDIYILIQTIKIILKSIVNKNNRPIEDIDYKNNFLKHYNQKLNKMENRNES